MAVGGAGAVVGDGAVSVLALPPVRSLEQRWPRRTTVTGTAIPTTTMVMAMDTRMVMATDIRTTAVVGKMAPARQCLFANAYWPRALLPTRNQEEQAALSQTRLIQRDGKSESRGAPRCVARVPAYLKMSRIESIRYGLSAAAAGSRDGAVFDYQTRGPSTR
jgi:hypothetical protein